MTFGQVPEGESPSNVLVGVPQLSEAVTRAVFAAGTSVSHCTVMLAGQVIKGGVVSLTLTVWLQVTGTVQLLQVKLEVNVKEPQLGPGFTETVVPVFPPLKVAPDVLLVKAHVMVDWAVQVPFTVTV